MIKDISVTSPYLVSFDGSFELDQCTNKPPNGVPNKDTLKNLI